MNENKTYFHNKRKLITALDLLSMRLDLRRFVLSFAFFDAIIKMFNIF